MELSKIKEISARDIIHLSRKYKDKKFITCDTESIMGKPYCIQFYDGETAQIIYDKEKNITDCFLDYIKENFEPGMVIWFYWMGFDMPMTFFNQKNLFTYDNFDLDIDDGDFTFHFVCDKVWFADCTYKGKRFYIRDAFQYFHKSLDKVSKDLKVNTPKMKRPDYIGLREPTDEERDYYETYSINDVLCLWEVVEWIDNNHVDYNIPISISIADFCGKIFKKDFMRKGDVIKALDNSVSVPALLSYHGGKSEFYLDHPAKIREIYEYDIVSAYPYAMSKLPNFLNCEYRKSKENKYNGEHGLYCITVTTKCPHWPIYTHDFKHSNYFYKTWITGYELLELIREMPMDEIFIHESIIVIEHEPLETNSLYHYVQHFFKKKNEATNPTERLFAKICLNALYGKFISKLMEDQYDEAEAKYVGGALFNPFIATLITGFVRAYVHRIEDVLQPFHTSTDSFITRNPDGVKMFPGENGLGALELKCQGNAYIFRRKLYLINDEQDNIKKDALHGFYSTKEKLWEMYMNRKNKYMSTYYNFERMVKLKEAYISRDPDILPFVMTNKTVKLGIDWTKFKEI